MITAATAVRTTAGRVSNLKAEAERLRTEITQVGEKREQLAGQRATLDAELSAAREALDIDAVQTRRTRVAAVDELGPVLEERLQRANDRLALIPAELEAARADYDSARERLAELDRERAGRPLRAEVKTLALAELPLIITVWHRQGLDVSTIAARLAEVEQALARLAVTDPAAYVRRRDAALAPPPPAPAAAPKVPVVVAYDDDGRPILVDQHAPPVRSTRPPVPAGFGVEMIRDAWVTA